MKRTKVTHATLVVLFLTSTTMADQICQHFYLNKKVDILKLIGLDNTRESVDRLIAEDDPSQVLWTIMRESKIKTVKPTVVEAKSEDSLGVAEWIAFNGSLANFAKSYEADKTSLTKNEVWQIYLNYKNFRERKSHLEENGYFVEKEYEVLKYSIEQLEKTIAETGFFRKLEDAGFSLNRPAGEKKKKTLSKEWQDKLQLVLLHSQFARVSLSGQISFDSMYSDSIRQRLMNGPMRRRLPGNFISLLKEANSVLGEFADTLDLKSVDLERVTTVLTQIDSLINRPEFKKYQAMNHASLFSSARANASELDGQLTQYAVLSKLIRPYDALLAAPAAPKVEVYDVAEIKKITGKMIDSLRSDGTNMFHTGIDIVGMAQKLEVLTQDMSAENLKIDAETKSEISRLNSFIETVTKRVPTRKTFSSFSGFSADEVVAANKMRAVAKRLSELVKN